MESLRALGSAGVSLPDVRFQRVLRTGSRSIVLLVGVFFSLIPVSASAAAPTITSFTPTSGPRGTVVTIDGTNFGATPSENSVTIGYSTATVTAASPAQLVAIVAQGAGTGPVCVTTLGQSVCDYQTYFIVTNPQITSVQPDAGDVGDIVTITGRTSGAPPQRTR